MCVFAVKFIPILLVLVALSAHTPPAVAQDAFPEFHATDPKKVSIRASLRFADFAGTSLGMTQGGMLMPRNGDSPALAGNELILAPIPLHENRNPKTTPIPSPTGWTGSEAAIVERPVPPEQGPISGLNPGLHFPALREATIANILLDLRKEYGPQIMTQPGNFHWFFESQRSLATGEKSHSLVACNKMSRWSSICASTDAKTFSVSFRAL